MQLYGLAVLFFTHNSTLHLAKTLEPTTMINILHEFALIFILLFPTYSNSNCYHQKTQGSEISGWSNQMDNKRTKERINE